MAGIYFLTGWFGSSFWTAESYGGLTRGDLMMWFSIVFGITTILGNIYKILTTVKTKRKHMEVYTNRLSYLQFVITRAPFALTHSFTLFTHACMHAPSFALPL